MSGGLVGAIGSATQRIKARFKAISDHPFVAIKYTFVSFIVAAATLSVVESVMAKQLTGISFYKLLSLGLGCILAEFIGLHHAIVAWHRAKLGEMVAYSAIWAAGFGFAILGTFDSAAENQAKRANLQKAAFIGAADVRVNLEEARRRVAADEGTLKAARDIGWAPFPTVEGKPVESVDAAKALIAKYEGQKRFFVELTNRCTEAQGPQMRAFCGHYADAKASLGALQKRDAERASVPAIEAQLAESRKALLDAKAKADNTTAVTEEETGLVVLATSLTGASSTTVKLVQSAQVAVTTMILMSLAGLVMGLQAIAGRPRTRWGRGRLNALLHGTPVNQDRIIREEKEHRNVDLAKALAAATGRHPATAVTN